MTCTLHEVHCILDLNIDTCTCTVLYLYLTIVYKSPEYDLLAYDMAMDRLVEVGYPPVSDQHDCVHVHRSNIHVLYMYILTQANMCMPYYHYCASYRYKSIITIIVIINHLPPLACTCILYSVYTYSLYYIYLFGVVYM